MSRNLRPSDDRGCSDEDERIPLTDDEEHPRLSDTPGSDTPYSQYRSMSRNIGPPDEQETNMNNNVPNDIRHRGGSGRNRARRVPNVDTAVKTNKYSKLVRVFVELSSVIILLGVVAISAHMIYYHRPGGVANMDTLTNQILLSRLILPANSTRNITIRNPTQYSAINYTVHAPTNAKATTVHITQCIENDYTLQQQWLDFSGPGSCKLPPENGNTADHESCYIARYWPTFFTNDMLEGFLSCYLDDGDSSKVYLIWKFMSNATQSIESVYNYINCEKELKEHSGNDEAALHQCTGKDDFIDFQDILSDRDKTTGKDLVVMRFCRQQNDGETHTYREGMILYENFYDCFKPQSNQYTVKPYNSVLVPLSPSSGGAGSDDDYVQMCIKTVSDGTEPVVVDQYGVPSIRGMKDKASKEAISIFDGALAILVGVTVVLMCLCVRLFTYIVC